MLFCVNFPQIFATFVINNTETVLAMRKFFILLTSFVLMTAGSSAVGQNAGKHSVRYAKWDFVKQGKADAMGDDFVKSRSYAATAGSAAWIRFESNNPLIKPNLTKRSEPICSNTVKGDTWLVEMPVENLDRGAVVDIWCPFHAYPTGTGARFAVEYRDGGKWLPMMPVDDDGANFRTSKTSRAAHFWQSFRLQKPIKRGVVALRVRQIDEHVGASYVSGGSVKPQIICYPKVELRDTTRVLFVGNSYTYYNNYPFIFKQMAMCEGHYTDCRMTYVGGYTMTKHLAYEPTVEAIKAGGYDYALFQDQSYERVFTGTEDDYGTLKGMTDIVAFTREHSPEVQPIIALTWGRKHGDNHLRTQDLPLVEKYPSFFLDFGAMQERLNEVVALEAKTVDAKISEQGPAWKIVRRERPDIELFVKDGSHPSYAGSYLAAAVSYITIFGEPFGDNASDGWLDAATASYLRSVAERVVLKGER